jgi:outer membrane protein TolC
MRTPGIVFVVCLSAALPAGRLAAQEPALSEAGFLAAVAADHPAEAALAAERDLAEAELLRASLLADPRLEASLEEPSGAARETAVVVAWTPPVDGRRALRVEAAEAGLAAAESRAAAARMALRRELREVYAAWALARERRELAAGQLVRVADLAEKARARAAAGEIAGMAARRLSLEAAAVRVDLARAEAALAAARARAAAWVPGLPGGARPSLPPLPEPPGRLPDPAERPDVAARRLDVERAESLRRLSRRILAAPSLGLGWKRVEEEGGTGDGPVVSVGWALPVLDRNRAERREAEARLAAARAELDLALARARSEQAGALAAYEALRREAAAVEDAAGEAGGLLDGATAAYRLGELGLTDFLDTSRAALAAQVSALELREAALAAHRDLEAAAGRPLTGDPR